jgi:hypothetical protein
MLQSVRVFPDLGLASIHQHQTGPYRAWTLARALDQQGRGWIYRADLESLAKECKINRRIWFYWLNQARELGLLKESKGGIVYLLSLEKTANILHVNYLHSSVDMPACKLAGV